MNRPLRFVTDVVVNGEILGLDASCTPERVTSVLGAYAENRQRNIMWRDYGAIEFSWERTSATESWRGTHVSLQVHRLSRDPTQMNEAVRGTYGDFDRTLPFDDLSLAVQMGSHLTEVPRRLSDEVREYINPLNGVTVMLAKTTGWWDMTEGAVWQITCGNPARAMGFAGRSAK